MSWMVTATKIIVVDNQIEPALTWNRSGAQHPRRLIA